MERYKTYSGHLKQIYGEKVYKLPVNLPEIVWMEMGVVFAEGLEQALKQ